MLLIEHLLQARDLQGITSEEVIAVAESSFKRQEARFELANFRIEDGQGSKCRSSMNSQVLLMRFHISCSIGGARVDVCQVALASIALGGPCPLPSGFSTPGGSQPPRVALHLGKWYDCQGQTIPRSQL